ncbi:MAG: UvrD-helicase domain-containing protein [Pseudomonadota bacterium]|nr:UvrD-helicase domain-containing protein [Pseudomonadota bacterium]
MTANTDDTARIRALQDLDATLLVEAAAGTGKTALIAGRLTMLLLSGHAPASLAAITFTEPAASELSARVHRYVEQLLAGHVPIPLKAALPNGLSESQRVSLTAASASLEELTTSTIHGFCQTLIHSYAVEANIDPGAQIMDATQAEIAFDVVFDRWFRSRLSLDTSNDPIAVLSREDPSHVVSTVRDLARFRLQHRTARPREADLSGRPDIDLAESVREFEAWRSGTPLERETDKLLADLRGLATFYHDTFASPPDFESLWRLAQPPKVSSMYKNDSFDLKTPQLKSAWQKAAGATDGPHLNDEMMQHFQRVDGCYRTLLGKVATALIARLSAELDGVLEDYEDFKRRAAVLDFDDLLYRARDLVRSHEAVRKALGERYTRILVDEFQDTDPIQAEILFRIAAADCPANWQDSALRDGALFMVGDPKQAIYRFRGADIEIYERARQAIRERHPENVLHITRSFRSMPEILAHVNRCFEAPLSAKGQPGYVALTSTRDDTPQASACVAKISIDTAPNPSSNDIREAEAEAVADVCARLIGNMQIVDGDGNRRPLVPADIALLAPTGTQLHRYERTLDERALPYSSQAGKNLFGRQEVQDLVSLARTLADPRDTLAFGALMRGPVVGLTEEDLLDITEQLPPVTEQPELIPRFNVLTDPEAISNPLAREVLITLQDLRRRASSTTPMLLLSEAAERLHLRALLAVRDGERSNRALANIDAFLELARGYDVRGLKRFVRDIHSDWGSRQPRSEGRVDTVGDAIEIVTIHSSKGLEWPVVILINTVTQFRSREKFIHRPADNTLHWVLGNVVPPDLHDALATDDESAARERERLLYVAYTRARDLLILPKIPQTSDRSWTSIVPDPYQAVRELDLSEFQVRPLPAAREKKNDQTAEVFADEQRAISESVRQVTWIRPSLDDLDRVPLSELIVNEADDGAEVPLAIGAGRLRGLILHKLMEEVLTEETSDEQASLTIRAGELLAQLANPEAAAGTLPNPAEMGKTVARTLAIPEIAALRPCLVAEMPIYGTMADPDAASVAGRADALFVENDHGKIVIDWKSDVDPSDADIALHAAQLRIYMRTIEVSRGALVYLSSGKVHWLVTDDNEF